MERWVDVDTAARWSSFPVDEVPRPIVLLDDAVRVEGGFVDDDAKLAWTEGAVEPGVSVPLGVLSRLPVAPRRQRAAQSPSPTARRSRLRSAATVVRASCPPTDCDWPGWTACALSSHPKSNAGGPPTTPKGVPSAAKTPYSTMTPSPSTSQRSAAS